MGIEITHVSEYRHECELGGFVLITVFRDAVLGFCLLLLNGEI
jgi:hypothetical protein